MDYEISLSSSSEAELHLRVHQAVLAAQASARQFGLVLLQAPLPSDAAKPDDVATGQKSNTWVLQLRNSLRDSDTVLYVRNRLVAVFLPLVSSTEDVELVIWRILGNLGKAFTDGGIPPLAPIIGAALFPDHASDARSMIACAEKALAKAHAAGNRFVIHTGQNPNHSPTKQMMTELRQAIVADQLFLTYQPKVNLADGQITGVEALARWQHPQRGVVTPDDFIPVAERTGLIIPLTLWVLQRALIQCRQWLDLGLNISVAVNLTMWNLETQELPDQIAGLLRDTRVPPANLELEITESSIMSDPQRVIATLNSIRSLGVQFAIDDFGTGYSSFAYLTKLPVKTIKIDKSFVQKIDTNRDNALIVRSIVDLGHNLGLKIVAEGVETLSAKQTLNAYGCDEAQGYYFSRPQPADEITRLLLEPPPSLKPRFTSDHANRDSLDRRLSESHPPAPELKFEL